MEDFNGTALNEKALDRVWNIDKLSAIRRSSSSETGLYGFCPPCVDRYENLNFDLDSLR
jgi:hypothetical protein